jgi:methylmalonyl-CoA mutase cobalamin-binding domain/chain
MRRRRVPPLRVVVADPGADGRDRSAADAVARALRDAGTEVVRIREATAAAAVRTCVQEDAAAVCVPGALVAGVRAGLAGEGLADVLVLDVSAGAVADVVAAAAALAGRP